MEADAGGWGVGVWGCFVSGGKGFQDASSMNILTLRPGSSATNYY